ncbi:ABC transporter substrate-binding protein [Halorubrum ezzemoulense]|uniref:ABC transporter substrate-binding protein n=1 Tax=Halorubrum ezzemoulense TaxID=337243 RepID=A0A256K8F7_HALEZ|nr:ABC transporter substrate-binding protein [Halorubrum ezzemoulense]OYR77351.1 ABC transporter substrate-binding protein [Halorubrum ezzemoulense]OYR86314.1 ABC transporter substrate-binding protein [Halorubrum ezzemoulense]QAY19164.1 ABC transporter substrate-binding protein [Halorubrum ezzemoulense]
MRRSDEAVDGHTRRAFAKYGGTVALGGLLAGCAGGGAESDPSGSDGGDESYAASISPTGEVTFESPPETVFTRLTHHAGMAFALGRSDGLTAMHAPDYYDGLWNQFVERLPGVSLDWSGLYSSWQPDKEKLYELDSDVHLADPAWITRQDAWSREDVDEIAERVSPWFGNSLSDRHQEPTGEWADGYQYYGLWEQFEIVAEAFRERERYEALAAVREELLATIDDGLPPESERPTAIMVAAADIEQIYAYTLSNPGFLTSHTRPLGPRDAFGGGVESGTVVDFETILEADPDVILYLGGFEPGTDMAGRRAAFEEDPVGSEVTAVKNDRIHPQGARYQGPILNLFQLEMTAKQLYPDAFGAWPRYEEGPYPEIPEDERLFDRQRVADAINGEL